jgi:hypothetical protein
MAVYKIFPTQDATIYSSTPSQNTGLDEILEVGCFNSQVALSIAESNTADDIRRTLIKFSNSDISSVMSLISGSYISNLRLFLANAENLSMPYTLLVDQLSFDWSMGTGKKQDYPVVTNGVCWTNSGSYSSSYDTDWATSYYLTIGGGGFTTTSQISQSFQYKDNKDLNVNVTPIVQNWVSDSTTNNGFIIKLPSGVEDNPNSLIGLSFFSLDTHTIYPPTLEFKWDDSNYSTGSLVVANNSNIVVKLSNNVGSFKNDTKKYIFNVSVRDKFPTRSFVTSSVYTVNEALPQTSYWALQDVKTEEMVIDFDTQYTKISCSSSGSYFPIYMSGLEPERYYKILIRVDLPSGESIDIDSNNQFKITR